MCQATLDGVRQSDEFSGDGGRDPQGGALTMHLARDHARASTVDPAPTTPHLQVLPAIALVHLSSVLLNSRVGTCL